MLIFSASMAQEGKSEMPFSLKGKKALSFSFNGFNLGEFYGGIGGKMWISNSVALFASVDMDYSSSTTKRSEQTNGNKSSSFSTGLTFGMNKKMGSNKRFLPYFGGSVGFSYSRSSSETNFAVADDYNNLYENGMLNINLGGTLGVESFITDGISLAAQHTLGLGFGTGSVKTTLQRPNQLDQVDEQDQSSFNFGFGTSSLILSVYF